VSPESHSKPLPSLQQSCHQRTKQLSAELSVLSNFAREVFFHALFVVKSLNLFFFKMPSMM
jgi:hypothetical protein